MPSDKIKRFAFIQADCEDKIPIEPQMINGQLVKFKCPMKKDRFLPCIYEICWIMESK